MKIDLNIEIEVPRMLNFLRIKGEKGTVDLGSLSDDAYQEFENQYIEALRKHWLKRKEQLND